MEEGLAREKSHLRRRMFQMRRSMDPVAVVTASRRIQAAVVAHPAFVSARAVGCYLAQRDEVQTDEIIAACWRQGKRVCVPAFNDEKSGYELVWYAPGDEIAPGRLGILEPTVRQRADVGEVDLHVIPGLAYDRSGGRLGHGRGYYDEILRTWSGLKVGVALDIQVLDSIPTGSHDVPVDLVVSEITTYVTHP